MTTIRVALRARPLQDDEEMSDITFINDQVTLNKASTFSFDTVYSPLATQQDIFDDAIRPLFDRFLKGEHGAIFTYGYKGSGKSYSLGTMPNAELEPSEEGILPRFARLLFRSLQQSKEDMSEVYASFVMVDREIRDLLVHSGMLLQDIQDLRQKRVYSTHDLLRLLNKKTMHDVDIVFTITLRHQKTVSKFHFIDISQKCAHLDLSRLDPFVQHCQHKLWFTCISCARQDLSLIQETLQYGHHLQPLSPEASQSLRSQITQLQLQIAHLQSNQLMEEEIKMIREEMEQIKSHSIQVSQELVETQSARDSLLLQLTQERPTEAHPLIQQYAQQIQDLKLEVTETRGKLNALCLEPSSPPTYPHYRITSSSLSTGRKKRPIIQRMRTSSSFKKHPKVDPLRLIDKSTDETVAPISHGIPLEEKTELDPVLSIMPSTSLYHDELEALAVPSWSDMPKTSSVASSKRKSISLDSMWDDTDSSITTSRVDLTINEGQPPKSKSTALNEHKLKRQNKSLLKMLHQIQADLLVKRELVGQLERSEDQFSQLRTNYEERLTELREHLMETQRQRDDALEKASVRPPGLRENREAQEVRSQFEVKLKRLVSENQELKRKQAELTKTIQTARSKAEAAIQRLKSENDSLKSDRKQLNRALKHEIDRARDAAAADEREIQQLKRRLVLALDAKTKAEETVEAQHQVLRKRTEETSAAHLQLRQLTNALRKAANEGTFLNEAALDRIMEYAQTSKSNIRTTKQTRTRASSFASEP